ncbi:MAG: DNA topoisomerase IB [Chloroflexota bacterium]
MAVDPAVSARIAGLRYVTDADAGIHRKRAGKHFSYSAPDGHLLHDQKSLGRIKTLAIPPAWTDVWISPSPNGHIQATGRDARGRKQYRYHPGWQAVRDETKYHRMIAFGEALPRIRERVDADLALKGLPREKVLAAIVRLLEETLIRVGNVEYARDNSSYGLTTMMDRHVDVHGSQMEFHFTGKSGRKHVVDVRDPRVARLVGRLQDLPGKRLFEYVDDQGAVRLIESHDVNEYLREISGEDFTAKDFRTWAGTLMAAKALQEFESFDSEAQAKKNIVKAIEAVAQRLGNTAAVCRKCYVHPEVINAYLEGQTLRTMRDRVEQEMRNSLSELPPEEAAVLALLQERLAREAQANGAA